MTAATQAKQLLETLQNWQQPMVDMLRSLVLAESPSHVPEAQAAVQNILREALIDTGFRVRKIRGQRSGGHLFARPENRKRGQPFQLLLGHCDTVWPVGTLSRMPFEQRGECLYGPGVYDMKAGLVQAIFALRALRACDLQPAVTPVLLLNSDEEIGSHESTPLIVRLARRCDRAFVMEPALGPEGHLKTTRKGVGRFVIRVQGRAAHAGLDPGMGASAILELSHVIQELFALNDPERGITVNVGTIDGGLRPNVVAPESSAQVDVRVATQEDAREIERAIHALQPTTPGTELQITGHIGRPPMETTWRNHELWRRARQAAAELGLEVQNAMAGGGSDGNTTSQYTATLDGLGAVGEGAHARHEHVLIPHLSRRAALLARLLLDPPMPPEPSRPASTPPASTQPEATNLL